MSHVFSYPAVYWAARFAVILLLVVAGWILLLACARYFRPSHIRQMLRADLPKVEELAALWTVAEEHSRELTEMNLRREEGNA